LCDIIVEKVKV